MLSSATSIQESPRVSVCIANYNGIGVIEECISSVLTQSCKFSLEIIVHDDASTDGSLALIRDLFPQIKLIASADNVGFCISNNRMAQVARGEFLLLLNNDAMLQPGALQALFDGAQEIGKPAILTLPQYDAENGKLIDAGSLLDPFLNPIPNHDFSREDVGVVIGACLWIPRKLWDSLGGFPEWFGSIAEDLYLCCAARLAGYPVRVVGKSGFRHWVGHSLDGGKAVDGKLTFVSSRRKLSERNKNFVILATYPLGILIIIFPLHALLLILEGSVLSCIMGNWHVMRDVYWTSLKELWTHRNKIHELRKHTLSLRNSSLKQYLKDHTWIPRKMGLLITHGWPRPNIKTPNSP